MKYRFGAAALALLAAVPAHSADVVGVSSGVFQNPLPSDSSYTIVGGNDFLYGDDATGGGRNELKFTGLANFSGLFEQEFKIGSLYYYNGSTYNPSTSVDLKVTLDFSMPAALPDSVSTFTLSLNSTPNNGINANDDADYVYFPAVFGGGAFVVGGTTYYVELTGFKNVVGDGFLASDSSELHVRENLSATADLYAKVTAVAPPGVPEPASWGLMIAGMAGIGATLRRGRLARRTIQFA